MDLLYKYTLYFFIYAFFGWCCETIYCSIGNRKVTNRGFLNGPICPIYGLGALTVVLMLKGYTGDIVVIFTMGLVMTSALEYATGVILEFLFHSTWWDYSNRMFNINGRVCLKNSILFGIMSILLMKIIHPIVVNIVDTINPIFMYLIVTILMIYLITDISITLNALSKLHYKLDRLEEIIEDLSNIDIQVKLERFTEENLSKSLNNLRHKDEKIKSKSNEIYNKILNVKEKSKVQKRLLKAFPNMNHKNKNKGLKYLKQILKDKTK